MSDVYLTGSTALVAQLQSERAKVKALREALERIAYGKGDSITGHLPAAECRRVAASALAATSDPIEAPSAEAAP